MKMHVNHAYLGLGKPHDVEEQCTVIAKVKEFSNLFIKHESTDFIDYDIKNDKFEDLYELSAHVLPNGYSTEGSISIVFEINFSEINTTSPVKMTCQITVIDVESNKKFPRSFEFFCDFPNPSAGPPFIIENYIPCRTLLNEPSEFLQNDTLTLQMDIILQHQALGHSYVYTSLETLVEMDFITIKSPDELEHYYLKLDSRVAECLIKESSFFERMLDTPMIEKDTKLVYIPNDKYSSLKTIACILLEADMIAFTGIDEIFYVYITADFYGIATVIDTCRCWLKQYLSRENISNVSKFADTHDNYLKQIVEAFREEKDGIQNYSRTPTSVNQEWSCEYSEGENPKLHIFNHHKQVEINENEKEAFNFYF